MTTEAAMDAQDRRSEELLAYDSAMCEPMTLDQVHLYNAELVGAATWLLAATPALAGEMRDAMKRSAERVLRR